MKAVGLYDPAYEHDACGVAFVARLDGVAAARDASARARRARATSSTAAPRAPTPSTGDGAGILLQMPDAFFRAVVGAALPPPGRYGVAVCFLPHDAERAAPSSSSSSTRRSRPRARRVVGWRDVPVDPRTSGASAAATAPRIRQLFVAAAPELAATGRVRAQALRDPARGRARRRPGPRDPELLVADARLQGDADRAAAAGLLPRPARRAHRSRRSRSSTRASRPTPSRAGSSRTRTG